MKRLFLLTAILAVFGLCSCEKEPSKAIVGTWEAVTIETSIAGINMSLNMEEVRKKLEFTFKADGTGSTYMESDGIGKRTEFKYSVNGNILTIIEDNETDEVPITFDENTMTMELSGEILGESNAKVTIYFQKI